MLIDDPQGPLSATSRPVIRNLHSLEQKKQDVDADPEPHSNGVAFKRTFQGDISADLKRQAAKRCKADRTDCGN